MVNIENKDGGKAIGHGGFGCVFKPALNCETKNLTPKNPYKYVSKLMLKKYAEEELEEIRVVKEFIKNIPDANQYFLVNEITTCKPDQLAKKDLINYNKKFKNLIRKGFTTKNINYKLDDLHQINIPYGGHNLEQYFKNLEQSLITNEDKNKSFVQTNKSIIKLLKNGIAKLNELGYCHLDVKSLNILREGSIVSENVKTKLIDWGLSGKKLRTDIPYNVLDRPIQFNVPFSNILFSSTEDINDFAPQLKETKSIDDDFERLNSVRHIASIYYRRYITEYSTGDIALLNELIQIMQHRNLLKHKRKIFQKNNIDSFIINYIAVVLDKYTNGDGIFEYVKYFNEVFSKNVDIWGFISCYLRILFSTKFDRRLIEHLVNITFKYNFSLKYAVKPIDIDKLIEDIEDIHDKLKTETRKPKYTKFKGIAKTKKKAKTKTKKKAKTKTKTKTKAKAKAKTKTKKKTKAKAKAMAK